MTSNTLVKDGVSVDIPNYADVVDGLSSSLGSWTVEFGQRQFSSTSCSGDALDCLTSSLKAFFTASSNAQSLLSSMVSKMLQGAFSDLWSAAGLASDAGSYSLSIDAISSDLSLAVTTLQSAMEDMDAALEAANRELSSLGDIELSDFKAINNKYFQAYEYGKMQDLLSNWKNLARIIQQIVKIGSSTPGVQSLVTAVQSNWKLLTLGNGLAAIGAWSSQQFGTATMSDLDDLVASNGTSADNSTSGNATTAKRPHFVHFSTGFSIKLFDILTAGFDEDAGVKTANDDSVNQAIIKAGGEAAYGPGYTTNMTEAMGLVFKTLPFIQNVYVKPTFAEYMATEEMLSYMRNMTEQEYGSDKVSRDNSIWGDLP